MGKTTTSAPAADVHGESAMKILGAIQKGFTKMSDVIDYCGPELVDERRTGDESEMDVPAALRLIDQLIDAGYIERRDPRFSSQLKLALTEDGKEAAPELSPTESELVSEYGVTIDSLRTLKHVIEYQEANEDRPYMERLINEFDIDLLAHQLSVLFNQLVNTGLAEEKGLFRFWIKPTDEGRRLVEEYNDAL
jgi:DNA-binding MarR family transcriptional regulator